MPNAPHAGDSNSPAPAFTPARRAPFAARHAPLVLAWLVYGALIGLALRGVLRTCGGRLTYALDDAYIHLAMARTLALHGTWGLHAGRFAHLSSSPLWVALLALIDRVAGVHEAAPFVLALLAGAALLLVLHRILRALDAPPAAAALVLVATVVLAPLPALVFTGQEHLLHALLSSAFLFELVLLASRPREPRAERASALRLAALALVLPLVRFESGFLCLAGAALLAWSGRRSLALALAALTCLPQAAIGLWARAHGWSVLPSSILLKSNLPRPETFVALHGSPLQIVHQMSARPHLLFFLVPAVALLALPTRRGPHVLAAVVFTVAALAHLQFGRVGWFYRYEAYLVQLGLLVFAWQVLAAVRERGGPRADLPVWAGRVALAALLLVSGVELAQRAIAAQRAIPLACRDIHDQQVQMGRFLARYYPGAPVAANDIGAISYLADADVLDLWGLASLDVARARLAGVYDRDVIERLARARGCRIAIVYDSWFKPGAFGGIADDRPGGMPAAWSRAGRWTLPEIYIAADSIVTFYAIDSTEHTALRRHLREFAPELPKAVRWSVTADDTVHASLPPASRP